MDILITGDLSDVTRPLIERLVSGHAVAAASEKISVSKMGKRLTTFPISPRDEGFEKIFNSYNFSVVIFFAKPLYTGAYEPDEYLDLANCLKLCSDHNVNQFLYVRQKIAETNRELPSTDVGAGYKACSILCEYYRMRRAMSIIICNTPVIYGYGENASVVGRALAQAKANGSVSFLGERTQAMGYLSQKDMGELLLRMAENWTTSYSEIDIPPADILTFEELGGLLKEYFPSLRLAYKAGPVLADTQFSGNEVRREYDWVPVSQIDMEIGKAKDTEKSADVSEKLGIWDRVKAFFKKHSFLLKIVELLLGFAVMELLNNITRTTIQFRYIDFRLLYIVILGIVHGMKTGLGAAALASVSLLASMITNHNNWSAVIYDIDTWLPFIFFFLVGAVTGYIKDKLTNENRFLSAEKEVLEEKYVLLNDFYASALKNKDKYKTQIVSYRNSFGRLFDVTRNLDSTVVDEIFNEALNALEDILDNHSVCIYRCFDDLYGRLIICSKEINNIVDKSLKLADFEEMVGSFQDGEVWVNRSRLQGYPEYAMPIYYEGKLLAIITLQKASYEQLAVYYENLIKIVCGLFKISLIHAIEYGNQMEEEMFIPGTRIMRTEYFREIIRAKEKMAQNGVSKYTILRFNTTSQSRDEIANRILRIVRATDVLGLGNDGELYLALSQTDKNNIKFVLKRLEAVGIAFSKSEDEEEL